MISELKKNIEQKMQKSVEALKTDLAKVRTGRAHTGLLDHVMVEYYGSMVPVNQVANITLIDARTIGVQTWEKPMLGKVERAIRDSDLGLNPANMGELLRVPMPALTEDRRRDLTKVVRHEGETAKEEKELTEDEGSVVSDADDTDEPEQQVMAAGATADPVKDYLKQIGKVALLNAAEEVGLPLRFEAGLLAEE